MSDSGKAYDEEAKDLSKEMDKGTSVVSTSTDSMDYNDTSIITEQPSVVLREQGLQQIGDQAVQDGSQPINNLIPARLNFTSTPDKSGTNIAPPLSHPVGLPPVLEEDNEMTNSAKPAKRKDHPDNSIDMGRLPHEVRKFQGALAKQQLNFNEEEEKSKKEDITGMLVGMQSLLNRVLADNERMKNKMDKLQDSVDGMSAKVDSVDETIHKAVDAAISVRLVDFEKKIDSKIDTIKSDLGDLETKVNKVKETVNIGSIRDELKGEMYEALKIQEENRRESETRSMNLIGKGIPESESVDPNQRKMDDLSRLRELAPMLFDLNLVSIKTTYRLGEKRGEEPRLMRVIFGSNDQRERYHSEQLSYGVAKERGVTFWRDRTLAEREERKRLEATRDRKIALGENAVIRGNRVVVQSFRGNPRDNGGKY